jgi:histone acetyltransferase (RNA polymerase elongator complex component)
MRTTPLIIPVFLPEAGCSERCLFCNRKATATGGLPLSSLRQSIESSLTRIRADRADRERQVAFYGGSFTAMPEEDQVRVLKEVQPLLFSGQIDSIRISTRPDALNEETLSLLRHHGVKTVEVGAQSMIDRILLLTQRGHGVAEIVSATSRLKEWGFEVGLHLMAGLPGETFHHFLQTLDRVIDLRPHFVRIHPTLVLEGSPLEGLWRGNAYAPLSLEETIRWLRHGVLKLERAGLPIIRLGLQATRELEDHILAGPYHPALHQLVDSAIAFNMAAHLLQAYPQHRTAHFRCPPGEVSNLRGQRNSNLVALRERFGLWEIVVLSDCDVPRGTVLLQTAGHPALLRRKDFHDEES